MITLRYAGSRGKVIVCSMLLGLLAACSGTAPNIEDGGFLSGEPCGPPCFRGIIPEVTTETEAMQILKRDELCKTYRMFNNEASGGRRGVYCTSSDVELAFQPDTAIVDAIGFRPTQIIRVEDVIARYGEPVAVSVAGSTHYPRTHMVLFYDSINADLSLPEQDGITFQLRPSTEVERISYCGPISCAYYRPKFLQEWKGYGEYRESFPPE